MTDMQDNKYMAYGIPIQFYSKDWRAYASSMLTTADMTTKMMDRLKSQQWATLHSNWVITQNLALPMAIQRHLLRTDSKLETSTHGTHAVSYTTHTTYDYMCPQTQRGTDHARNDSGTVRIWQRWQIIPRPVIMGNTSQEDALEYLQALFRIHMDLHEWHEHDGMRTYALVLTRIKYTGCARGLHTVNFCRRCHGQSCATKPPDRSCAATTITTMRIGCCRRDEWCGISICTSITNEQKEVAVTWINVSDAMRIRW